MKIIYTLAIVGVVLMTSPAMAQHDTISIDLGDPGAANVSAAPWNNLTDYTMGSLSDLTNNQGMSTSVGITVTDSFNLINTAGVSTDPQLPATATGDSFFGSMQPGVGGNETTGGFTITGLDVNQTYGFGLYASRVASDNRESKYVVQGANMDSTALDVAVSSPGPQMVWVTGIRPAPDSSVIITATAGPNNNNSTGYYYIGVIQIAYVTPPPATDTVAIDFGDAGSTSPAPWNNLTDFTLGSAMDLTTKDGTVTGMSIAVTDSFNGINTAGVGTDPVLPASATGDSFFGSMQPGVGGNEVTGGFTIHGLEPDSMYHFGFYASRVASDNRETKYIAAGANSDSTTLNVAVSNPGPAMVWVYNIMPRADSSITITATAGPNNDNSTGYYYIGLMEIAFNRVDDSGLDELPSAQGNIYPNPSKGAFTIEVVQGQIRSVKVYDVKGLLTTEVRGNGGMTQQMDLSALPMGIYLLKVQTDQGLFTSKLQIR